MTKFTFRIGRDSNLCFVPLVSKWVLSYSYQDDLADPFFVVLPITHHPSARIRPVAYSPLFCSLMLPGFVWLLMSDYHAVAVVRHKTTKKGSRF